MLRRQHGPKQSKSARQPNEAAQRIGAIACMCRRWPRDQLCPTSCCCAHPIGDMYRSSAEPIVACRRKCRSAERMRQPAMPRQPSHPDLTQERLPRGSMARYRGMRSRSSNPEEAQHAQQLQDGHEEQVASLQQDANDSRPSVKLLQDEAITESSHALLLSQIDAFMESLQGPLDAHETAQQRQPQHPQHEESKAVANAVSSLDSMEAWHKQHGMAPAVMPGRLSGLSAHVSPHAEGPAWPDEKNGPPCRTRQQAAHSSQDNGCVRSDRADPDRQRAERVGAECGDVCSDEGTAIRSDSSAFRDRGQQDSLSDGKGGNPAESLAAAGRTDHSPCRCEHSGRRASDHAISQHVDLQDGVLNAATNREGAWAAGKPHSRVQRLNILSSTCHIPDCGVSGTGQSSLETLNEVESEEVEPDEAPSDAIAGFLTGVSGTKGKASVEVGQSARGLGSLQATLQRAKHNAPAAGHRCREPPSLHGPDATALYDLIDGAMPSSSAFRSGFERACAGSKPAARRLSSLEHVSQASLDELEALLAEQRRKVRCLQGPCLCHRKGLLQSDAWFKRIKSTNAMPSSRYRLTGGCIALQLASLGLWPDEGTAPDMPWHAACRPAAGRHSSALYVMADALSDAISAL